MPNSSDVIIDTETNEERHVGLIDNGDGTYSISVSPDGEIGSSGSSGSSGGSVGGSTSTYSNLQGDFIATANSGAKTITLSLIRSELSAVLSTKHFLTAVIKRVNSAGEVDILPTTNIAYAAGVLTLADMDANFASGDEVAVLVQGPDIGLRTYISGEDSAADVLKTEQRSSYLNMSADAAVKGAPGRLFGIFVASDSSTPTIKIWDNTAASGAVLINTFTPVAGTFYPFPGVQFINALFVDVGGTVDITVFFK